MKYGIVISDAGARFAPIPFKGDLVGSIIKAKALGYDGVEITVKTPGVLDASLLKDEIDKRGMSIPALGTGQIFLDEGLSFSDPDCNIREAAVCRIKEFINFANSFNSSIILGLVNGRINDLNDKEESLKRISDCLYNCLEYSGKYNTSFLIESINRYETNIFNEIKDAADFLNRFFPVDFDKSRIGILADTFHMNIEEKDMCESLSKYSNLIKHIHFADSNRWPPGYGHTDFKKVMEMLKIIGYKDFISFEMLPFPDPDIASKQAINFVKDLEVNNQLKKDS